MTGTSPHGWSKGSRQGLGVGGRQSLRVYSTYRRFSEDNECSAVEDSAGPIGLLARILRRVCAVVCLEHPCGVGGHSGN